MKSSIFFFVFLGHMACSQLETSRSASVLQLVRHREDVFSALWSEHEYFALSRCIFFERDRSLVFVILVVILEVT